MDHVAEEPTGYVVASTEATVPTASIDRLFDGGGEMGRILAGVDWGNSSLGPVDTWPHTLRTSIRICLTSRHAMIVWWGPEHVFFYNDAYAPTLGVKRPWAAGKPGREVWSEIWDTIGPMLEGVLQSGEPTWSDDQRLFLERSGYSEETYHTFSYSPIEDDTGAVMGIFTAVTETTQRVLSERRNHCARDLAAAVVDARTTEEVCARTARLLERSQLDIPFSLLYRVNASQQTLTLFETTGLPPATRLSPLSISPTDDSPWASITTLPMPRAQLIEDIDWSGVAFQGDTTLRPTSALALAIVEPGQTQPTLIWVAGVSPHRALDSAYQAYYDLLSGHLATALAAAHAYEEERQRAEALATIDRAKTTFFSNVSHEFRTPLTLMLGPIADSLADSEEPLPPRQQGRIEVARRNAMRLLKLVNTLLDFSRIEAGRVRATYESTDVASYTAELASAFRSLIEKANLALVVDCPPLDNLSEPLYVDREMWEKIVLNLLSNAFKYTFAGTITVALRAVDGGGGVELEVRDTGEGIPADELPRIFERFHRIEGMRARTHEGSGIGLALVQELVHLHSGVIRVESVEGNGTSVFVRLSTGTAHLPADHIQTRSTLASTALGAASFVQEAERWLPDELDISESPASLNLHDGIEDLFASAPSNLSNGHRARIVLADDNTDMRGYLRRLLSERYHVETVSNGRAALEAIQRQPPDLVLTDVMMPELDGFGLLAALRSDPHLRPIPVILLSARAGAEATVEGLQAGADDYLIKPFSAREVLSRVEARLEMARLRNEAVARAQELEGAFEAIADAAFVYDRDGRIVRMNSAAQTLFTLSNFPGYAERTPEQRSQLISAHDENGQPIPVAESGLYRLLRGESLTGDNALDVQLHLTDGRALEVNITGAPLFDATGAISGAVAVSRDVTARRRLERVVRESEARLRSVLELLPVGVALVDETGKPEIVNQALKAVWGEDVPYAESMTDYGEYKAWWPETGKQVQPEEWGLSRALTQGEVSLAREIDIEAYDGKRKTILQSDAPLRDEMGAIVGGMSVLVDITERKQLERRTHDALDALLSLTEDLVRIPSSTTERPTETLTEIGARLVGLVQRVFGCDMAVMSALDTETGVMQPLAAVGLDPEVEALWWRDVAVTPLHEYLAPETLAQIYARKPMTIDVKTIPFNNGADYHVHHILLAPLVLGETIVGLMSIEHSQPTRPYTDEDLALMMAMGRLSALAIEREHLLRERTEGEARELAATASKRQMDEFLGIASHELRTPLTSISANVQMAERSLRAIASLEPASEVDNKLKRAHLLMERTSRQVARLDRLVGDLLDVSRIQAGKLELRIESSDLLSVTREAVQEQRAAWPGRGVTLDLPRRASVQIRADADRIGQVVTNYLTNALKYSPADTSILTRVRMFGGMVRVEVRDQGPGLTPTQRERLFERFYRVPGIEQQSGSGVGLGLGLHICKTIIERHGGQVGVDSVPGEGATFWFTLPLDHALDEKPNVADE